MTTTEEMIVQLRTLVHERWGEEMLPVTDAELAEVADWTESRMGFKLPPELIGFWRQTNGCGLDGATLYGAREAMETTMLYIDDYPDYFMIGQCDDGPMYAYDKTQHNWPTLEQLSFGQGPRAVRAEFDDLANMVLGLMLGEEWKEW